MKTILIAVLVVALVALAGVLVWQNWPQPAPIVNNQPVVNQPSVDTKCVPEGHSGGTQPSAGDQGYKGVQQCCAGSSRLPVVAAGAPLDMLFVCGKCGNGVCGLGENYENCVQDCAAGSAMEQSLKQLVITKWGDCTNKCKTFSINVNYNADTPSLVVTYDGMYDDSTRTEIISASLSSKLDSSGKQEWVIDESIIDRLQICQPGRGHQTASKELCL